jgi:biotin transport system substrate-specific component
MNEATGAHRTWSLAVLVPDRRIRTALGGAAFVIAMTISAYVAIPVPWSPVPMTLQPMVALLAGALLGPLAGAAAMASYLAVGVMGAPVFAGGHAGLPWLVGPTGGYLMAFPAAALVVGLVVGRRRRWLPVLLGLLMGLGTIYLGGITQLAVLTAADPRTLLALGVVPFLGGDLIKVVLALVLVMRLRKEGLGGS